MTTAKLTKVLAPGILEEITSRVSEGSLTSKHKGVKNLRMDFLQSVLLLSHVNIRGSKLEFHLPKAIIIKKQIETHNFECLGEQIIFFFFVIVIQNTEAFGRWIVGNYFSFVHFTMLPFYFNISSKKQRRLIWPIERHGEGGKVERGECGVKILRKAHNFFKVSQRQEAHQPTHRGIISFCALTTCG
jgi:hypothetical protein